MLRLEKLDNVDRLNEKEIVEWPVIGKARQRLKRSLLEGRAKVMSQGGDCEGVRMVEYISMQERQKQLWEMGWGDEGVGVKEVGR